MVQGFNHNIKHKGKLYHIQTEDSGRDNPHIITHVFVGGNILASKKTSYAEILQADRLEQVVRELMEEQHKSVLRNLINGVYDDPSSERFKEESKTGKFVRPPQLSAEPAPAPAPLAGGRATPAPAPHPPSVPPAPRSGAKPSEKSLDEIILSYLADRDGD